MSIEDLRNDVEEYNEAGDHTYAQALEELIWYYENEPRRSYYIREDFHNTNRFPDYPKVNL